MYAHRHARANLHLLGQSNTFSLVGRRAASAPGACCGRWGARPRRSARRRRRAGRVWSHRRFRNRGTKENLVCSDERWYKAQCDRALEQVGFGRIAVSVRTVRIRDTCAAPLSEYDVKRMSGGAERQRDQTPRAGHCGRWRFASSRPGWRRAGSTPG